MSKNRRSLISFILTFFILLTLALPLQAYEKAKVLSIVDGDTVKVIYHNREESIRLIGIDTPETRPNKKAIKDAQRTKSDMETITSQGREAKNFVKGLVKPGDLLEMEFDIRTRDKYGRLLAYLYLSSGKMLNEEIVKAGYAQLMTIPPNLKYQERFLMAYREARESHRGLWK
jgi:micrococcal nuclease